MLVSHDFSIGDDKKIHYLNNYEHFNAASELFSQGIEHFAESHTLNTLCDLQQSSDKL